jgi:hypothetical protein
MISKETLFESAGVLICIEKVEISMIPNAEADQTLTNCKSVPFLFLRGTFLRIYQNEKWL